METISPDTHIIIAIPRVAGPLYGAIFVDIDKDCTMSLNSFFIDGDGIVRCQTRLIEDGVEIIFDKDQ